MPPKIEGILFDKDGTLVDYHATWAPINRRGAAWAAAGDAALADALLKIGGHDPATDRVAGGSLLAAGDTRQIAEAWRAAGSPRETGELVRELDRIFVEGGAQAVPVAGVAGLFAELARRRVKTGVATSDSEAGARATLAAIDLADAPDFVAGYDSGHGSKPGAGMALAFCSALSLAPAAVAMVGDNLHDMAMGRAAGCGLCVGVLTGTSTAAELWQQADRVIADVTHLPALLDALS